MADIERLLGEHMGLDVESLGAQGVLRAVRERQAACGFSDPESYSERLRGDANELQELVEAVVVPETWFFRDREAFARMTSEVASRLCMPGRSSVRLLSVPCSTGEEPYSMVMALLDAGVSRDRFSVDAIDISQRALRHAQAGVYGNNSFRAADLSFRERYFERQHAAYRLSHSVREMVSFRHGNLYASALPSSALYDFIFCRNALIYFQHEAQKTVLQRLGALLAPLGVLFVGPSETGLALQAGFASLRVPFAFAFRKADLPLSLQLPRAPTSDSVPGFPPRSTRGAPRLESAPECAAAPARECSALPTALGLDDIARMADEGRLNDATRACDEHLRQQAPSARAYCLRALLSEASGQADAAVELYRKALYLDPNHEETLVQLALLMQKRGDAAAAERMRARARRVAREGGGA